LLSTAAIAVEADGIVAKEDIVFFGAGIAGMLFFASGLGKKIEMTER